MLCGWLYGHLVEYGAHRFILHNRSTFLKVAFKHHFKNHHAACKKNMNYDEKYARYTLNPMNDFEQKMLFVLLFLHLPFLFIFPYFYYSLIASCVSYYVFHTLSHTFPAWGRKWLPWHYDHHLGSNQHLNWGVRLPIFDILLGTRKKYVGSLREFTERLNYLQEQDFK